MEPNLSQALHLLNGTTVENKIREGKLIERRLAEGRTLRQIVEELYLSCFTRKPSETEWAVLATYLEASDKPGEVLEDTFWAILNAKEFLFNH